MLPAGGAEAKRRSDLCGDQRQRALLVGERVADPLAPVELVERAALGGHASLRRLLVEVDAVAVPAQLPGDHDRDQAEVLIELRAHLRRPQRAREACGPARILAAVEDLERQLERPQGWGLALLGARPSARPRRGAGVAGREQLLGRRPTSILARPRRQA